LRGTAFHEAAHAVVARHFGCTIVRVSIGDELAGGAEVDIATTPLRHQFMIARAPMACMKALEIPEPHDIHAFSDEVQMSNILAELYPDDKAKADQADIELVTATDDLFQRPDIRSATKALAEVLYRERYIGGQAAMTLIDSILEASP
jgi:hypothetical protein